MSLTPAAGGAMKTRAASGFVAALIAGAYRMAPAGMAAAMWPLRW